MSATVVKLTAVTVIGTAAKVEKDVASMISADDHFAVVRTDNPDVIKMSTPTKTYVLKKHPTQNYFACLWGRSGKRKMQVSLKKIVGEVRYW